MRAVWNVSSGCCGMRAHSWSNYSGNFTQPPITSYTETVSARMKDIAQDLGVSLMTVSKALRSHSDISEETRRRVMKRARELNYRPNWIARSLVTRRTYMVGFTIPDLMHSLFAHMPNGVARRFEPLGYQIVISNSEENPEA